MSENIKVKTVNGITEVFNMNKRRKSCVRSIYWHIEEIITFVGRKGAMVFGQIYRTPHVT